MCPDTVRRLRNSQIWYTIAGTEQRHTNGQVLVALRLASSLHAGPVTDLLRTAARSLRSVIRLLQRLLRPARRNLKKNQRKRGKGQDAADDSVAIRIRHAREHKPEAAVSGRDTSTAGKPLFTVNAAPRGALNATEQRCFRKRLVASLGQAETHAVLVVPQTSYRTVK